MYGGEKTEFPYANEPLPYIIHKTQNGWETGKYKTSKWKHKGKAPWQWLLQWHSEYQEIFCNSDYKSKNK